MYNVLRKRLPPMPQDNSSRRNVKDQTKPSNNNRIIRLLVLVKAAPLPSTKYLETICTAGIDQNGNWYRLYPIPFRYLTSDRQFSKYQWIEVEVAPISCKADQRKESYRPNPVSIRSIGKPLPAGKATKRKQILLPIVRGSVESLKDDFFRDGTSLGMIKPKRMIDFVIRKSASQWTGKKAQAQYQMKLFDPQPKELQKVPYDFYYIFQCSDPRCKKHELSIHDWEIYASYYSWKKDYGYAEDVVLEKLRMKWLDQMWDQSRDSHLYLGTVHSRYKRPIFVVLGVFWPPK